MHDDDEDVHSARTVPPPDGGDAYSEATVVREIPDDILAAIEPDDQKLGALTLRQPLPSAALVSESQAERATPNVVVADAPEAPVHQAGLHAPSPGRPFPWIRVLVLVVGLAIWIWSRWL